MSARSRKSVTSATQLTREDFSFLENLSFDENIKKISTLEKCVSYIRLCKEPATVLVDVKAFNALITLLYSSTDTIRVCEDTEFIEIISKVIPFYRKDLEVIINIDTDTINQTGFDNLLKRQYLSFQFILSITWNISNSSNAFRKNFLKFHGTRALFEYLDNDDLIMKMQKFKGFSDFSGTTMIKSIIGSLNNLSLIALNQRCEFENMQAKRILLKFIKFLNDTNNSEVSFKTIAEMTLVNILSDNDIDNVPDAKSALSSLVTILKTLSQNLKTANITRVTVDFEIDDFSSLEISHNKVDVVRQGDGLHLAEIASSIYRLAINEKLKIELYGTHAVREILFVFIQLGNEWEKMFALKLLWQLCFDKEIAKKVSKDNEFYDLIKKTTAENANKYVKKYGQGIVWSIDNLDEKNQNKDFDSKKNHIMISYNRNSRALCLKIKAELERLGHSVWIDVDNIHGSTLEAMANAIEESKCVLICMTEEYKQSVYCRAEAEYTFTAGKPFVPLILQENYKPDGWLGIILGAKMFVNFTKYSFEECSKRLQNEILKLTTENDKTFEKVTVKPLSTAPTKSQLIENWSTSEVQDWLNKNDTNEDIKAVLRKFNGKMLSNLNSIRISAPDYFYDAVSKNNTIDLFSVVKFNEEFLNLFQ